MFQNAAHALDWAYNAEARPILKTAMINKMRGSTVGRENPLLQGLTAQDLHGQAAQIIGMVEKLPDPAGREYLAARFGRRIERNDLTVLVYRGCDALGVGLEKREGVYRVMRGYFGGDTSLKVIRRTLGCRYTHAVMTRHCLYDVLKIINDQSLAEMERILELHGLIEAPTYA